ncbi:hypothetical protein HY408_02210 [Candidatus Gottesmanbacteria bacterium]|nr:hypothetical protein [Candidatus Gottesmanbacteria bacterium]
MNRLVLIDGNAIMHRAYHALPMLTNKKGEVTNAVYGFVSMLLRVVEDLKPTHMAVAFDRPKPTFRKELFKEYQAHRPEMEEGLSSQFGKVHEVVEAMHIPIYEMDGFEADDVIGTLAEQVQKKKLKSDGGKMDEVVVVTGDRDLLQLVNHRVNLFMPVKGMTEAKLFGEKEAEERMGVPPKQIPDLKALCGDPSDNYPGVAGIGPKTAAALLKQFGTVENLYNHLDEISNATLKDKLIKGKEAAFLSHQLATVVRDVPVAFDPHKALLTDFVTPEVIEVFNQLGFKTLLKRITGMTKREQKDVKKPVKKDKEQLGLF